MADILVTDDDEQLRTLIRATLESKGHSVAEAEDGADALRHPESHRPHLLITDMHMPGMDGLALTRHLRTMAGAPPIIGMSGHDLADTLKMAEMLGAKATLKKPFTSRELLDAVAKALSPTD
jgi:CheY-like chemotaxis protein